MRRVNQQANPSTDTTFPTVNPYLDPQTAIRRQTIRQIFVPVDAVLNKLSDVSPILLMARRFGAKVTLLHCYTAPPCFDFAISDAAIQEVSLHRERVRTRLYDLARDSRKLYSDCIGRFAIGSLPAQILRQSRELKADLIAVPLPLDLISWCWLPAELLDELIRKADCPVLCVPASQSCAEPEISHFSKHV